MSATFDERLTTLKDHIRLALGDTDVNVPMLSDEVIAAKLAIFSFLETLAQLAEALASQYAQRPDSYSEYNGTTVRWSNRVKIWQQLAIDARSGKILAPVRKGARSIAVIKPLAIQASTDSGFRSD